MFDFVSKHKRLLQFVLALLIVPPFAFWGITSYERMGAGAGEVATVGDQTISEQEFTQQLRSQQDRIRSLLGAQADLAALDTPASRRQILESMISQRLIMERLVKNHMTVTDDALRETIASIPAFQENGKFSAAHFQEALRAQGYTPQGFEASLRGDLLRQQFASAVNESNIVSRAVAREWALIAGERRELEVAAIPASSFAAQVKVTSEAVKAFYDANLKSFEIPEQARVQYVVLSAEALAAQETVTADEVKTQFEARRAQFEQKEERQVSHILLAVKEGASAAEKEKLRLEAQRLAEQLKKNPAGFAEAAKKRSDDAGSAHKGGDLGMFSRGMIAKAVEDAAFAMKPNEISGPVESEFGFHILRLAAIKASKMKPLEEVRGEIEQEIRKQRAGRRFAEAAETFSNLVYEQPDSLKPVAERFKLPIQDGGWVTRGQASTPLLNRPRMLSALFAEDSLKNGRNTEAMELSPGMLVSARVVEHKPATQRALEEVRAEVTRRIVERETSELARKKGEEQLALLEKGEKASLTFARPRTIGREGAQDIAPEVVQAAFRVKRDALPGYAGVQAREGYLVLRVSKVVAPSVGEIQEKGAQAELGRDQGARQLEAFVAALRSTAKVTVNEKALDKRAE